MSQSVKRAASIVDSLAADPKTVVQLAAEFGMHRSTIFREMQTLEEVGYARRRKDGTYAPGFHLVALAQSTLGKIDLREIASGHLRQLHKIVGNTLHVAALVENSIIYVDKVEDSGGVRMYSRIGAPVRPHCSGVGKAILANLEQLERDAVLSTTDWKKYTEKTILTRTKLDLELATIAGQGWAEDNGEFEDFINCVAVPIDTSAGVVGALSLTALNVLQDIHQLKAQIPLMQQTAARISRELG